MQDHQYWLLKDEIERSHRRIRGLIQEVQALKDENSQIKQDVEWMKGEQVCLWEMLNGKQDLVN